MSVTSAGTTLGGRYRLTRPLGRGGMAEVWEAHDEVLQRRVAVKLFASHDDADARRAAAEMHTLAALDHPNLVTVHDAGTDGDRSFLVMELVDGETLADRVRRGPVPAAEAAALGAQIAAGLAHIHQRGIVHRDVKPANILLPRRDHDDAPVVKLADFGIAQHAGAERLTATGTTIGTAAYLSPEQLTGKPVGPAADVYSLGLVLLEVLGRAPAWTGTPIEIALARLNTPVQVPDDLGPVWAPLLRAMTSTDPVARPPAARVRETLAATAAGTTVLPARTEPAATTVLPAAPAPGTRVLPVPPPPPPPDDRRRRRVVLAGALALVLAGVAVVLGVTLGGGSDPVAPVGDQNPTAATSAPATTATQPVAATSAPSSDPATASTPDTPTTAAPTSAPATPEQPTAGGPGNGNGNGGGPGNGGPGGPGNDKTKPGKP